MGYHTRSFLIETGTLFLVMNIVLYLFTLTLILKLFTCKSPSFVRLVTYLESKMMYNVVLRLLIESYLVLVISSTINVMDDVDESIASKLSYTLSWAALFVIIVLPVLSILMRTRLKN